MPIIDLQRRLREIGRIRIGKQVPTNNGKTRPAKLDTFRLTSQDQRVIEAAAELYGGTPEKWEDAPDGVQWQVFTTVKEMPVVVPPGDMGFSQFYETWSAGGCKKRCDGLRDVVRDCPCDCDPNNRECDIHSRLSVMLPALPGFGLWRLDTQGYYAAVELQGVVDLCRVATEAGRLLPARLQLQQRSAKRPDPKNPNKVITLRWAVPCLEVDVHLSELGLLSAPNGMAVTELAGTNVELPEAPGWKPVGELPPAPGQSVREQMAEADAPKPAPARRNAQQPIPSTGMKPRAAAERTDAPKAETGRLKDDAPGDYRSQMSELKKRRDALWPDDPAADAKQAAVIVAMTNGRTGATAELSKQEMYRLVDVFGRELTTGHFSVVPADEPGAWELVRSAQDAEPAPAGGDEKRYPPHQALAIAYRDAGLPEDMRHGFYNACWGVTSGKDLDPADREAAFELLRSAADGDTAIAMTEEAGLLVIYVDGVEFAREAPPDDESPPQGATGGPLEGVDDIALKGMLKVHGRTWPNLVRHLGSLDGVEAPTTVAALLAADVATRTAALEWIEAGS